MNTVVLLESELAYHDDSVQHINHYTGRFFSYDIYEV